MATVAQLDVRIGADIQSFQQGMAKMQRQLSQVGSNLRNTGRQLSTAVTLPILGIAGAAVKAASDVEEMQSKFNTVFKTVGGDVAKQIDAFAKASGRSRYQLQGMAAEMGDLFKPMGYTEKEAGKLSVQVAKLAVDLGSFNNMPMDEALARLRGTLVGSHENALAFAVTINEASLKQELMRMGAHKLTGAQLNQAKVQARLNLLMAGTTDAQGDAIRTSDSFANQFLRLKNATYDLGVTIGEMLLPYANQLVGRLQGMVDYVQNLNPETKKLGIIIAGAAAAAGPLIFALGGLASSLGSIFRVISLTMGLFNPYVAAFAALAAIAVLVYRNFDAVQAVIKNAFNYMKEWVKPIVDAAIEVIGSLIDTIVELGVEMYAFFVDWYENNKEEIKGVWDAVGTVFEWGLKILVAIVEIGTDAIVLLWRYIGQPIIATITLLFQTLANIFGTGFEILKNVAESGVELLKAIFKGDWGGAWDAFTAGLEGNLDALVGFGSDFKEDFLNALDLAYTDIDERAQIKDWKESVKETLGELPGDAADSIKGFVDEIKLGGSDVEDTVEDIKGKIEKVAPLMSAPLQQVAGVISGNPDSLKEVSDSARKSVDELFKAVPKKLDMPDGLKELVDEAKRLDKPTVARWYEWDNALRGINEHVGDFADHSSEVAGHWAAIEGTLELLKVDENSKFYRFVEGMRYGAEQVVIFVEGLEAMIELMKAETWLNFYNDIMGILRGLGALFGITGQAFNVPTEITIPGSEGQGTPIPTGGTPTPTGGVPTPGGLTGQGGGDAVVPGLFAAGAGAAGGMGALAGLGIGGATIATFYGVMRGLSALMGGPTRLTPEMIAQYQGGNLAGAFRGTLGSGGIPSWMSGLQGYMGGAPAVGMGMTTGGQTINVNLDGQTIAQATMPYWSQELEIYGTNR